MKRRILLVDDEVAVLLTLKAVLEISGYEVDTAASAKEARSKLKKHTYAMVITDMRMESDAAGKDVIRAARSAEYHPAVALLTAFPVAEEDWQEMGADNMLVKPMHTRVLIEQIADLLASHETRLEKLIALQVAHDERIEAMLAEHDAEIAAIRNGRSATRKSSRVPAATNGVLPSKRTAAPAAGQKKPIKDASEKKTLVKKTTVPPSKAKKLVKAK